MSNGVDREAYIPLKQEELVDLLCSDEGLTSEEREAFRSFCQLLGSLYNVEYFNRLEKVKSAYAAFDPDADTRSLVKLNAEERLQKQNALFNELAVVLEEADYRHLDQHEMEPALHGHSAWGLRMDVDFRVFERLVVFVRGNGFQKRALRRLRKAMRNEEVDVPIYQRLVMVMKLRQHRRLGRKVDTEKVYLQLFKDIPTQDLNMLFPGARSRMSYFDRSRIGLPLFSGLLLTFWQIMQDVGGAIARFINDFIMFKPAAIWAAATGTVGYGVKSYYGYYQTKQRYNLALTQVLYFQNLDTNAGVLFRLLDEAREQDCREGLLAYYALWRHGGELGWTSEVLESHIEIDLHKRANLQIDFDEDTLIKLEKRGIVEHIGNRFRAVPLPKAMAVLQESWRRFVDSHIPTTVEIQI